MRPIGSDFDRDIKKALATYMPKYYEKSKVVSEIVRVDSEELELLHLNFQDVLDQFSLDTATWGLVVWEKNLGVPINPQGKDYETRRSILKSKLRGVGVVNTELIKSVAESFSNGSVAIQDLGGTIKVTFVGKLGIPAAMEDIKIAINDIMPAHLVIQYVFTYITWERFDFYNLTWSQWDAKNLTWDQWDSYSQ